MKSETDGEEVNPVYLKGKILLELKEIVEEVEVMRILKSKFEKKPIEPSK